MSSSPVVSVVLPVWNGEKYLRLAIDSIVGQTFEDFELVIVNDCSTDKSLQIAKELAAKDSRVRVVGNDVNMKLPATLNRGFGMARGSYYTWISHDNLYRPEFLERMLADLQSSRADIVYSDFNIIDSTGSVVDVKHVKDINYLGTSNVVGASFLYRKEVHERLKGFDVSRYLYEDYDFWVRAHLEGFKFFRSDRVVYDYREHGESLTSARIIPGSFAIYRYELRNKVKGCGRRDAFELRDRLLAYRTVLGMRRWFVVMAEALVLNPVATMKIILGIAGRIPAKLGEKFRGH